MLSLSPRYDLFRFLLPRHYIPEEVSKKWQTLLSKEPGVITKPIDYLNESIKGITLPGISDLVITQQQHSSNSITRTGPNNTGMGRLNVEPNQNNSYVTAANPLDKISREFKVTFRMNQGFTNYFMMYETLFYRICKPELYDKDDDFSIDLMDETGRVYARIKLSQCIIDGIDGLDLSYDKVERQSDTFDITWKFNNIDFELITEDNFQ